MKRRIVINVETTATGIGWDIAKGDDAWLKSLGFELDFAEVERAKQDRKQSYKDYLQSPEWREKATAAKEKAGWKCQICNRDGNYSTLNAHHRTYERVRNELPEDLIVLCGGCHEVFHSNGRLAK